MGQAQREADQHKRGRKGECHPGGQHAGPPRALQADRHAHLAAGRPGQELAHRDQIRIGVVVQPAAAVHEFGAEIRQMRDRTAERRQAQAQENQEHFQPGPPSGLRARIGGGSAGDVFVMR
ncbi:hypothetical protein D3C72_2051020 [compost metagenome]